MGELFVEEGTIPGDSPHTLTGADGTIWHPTGRWAATVIRLCGGIAILDAENNFNPVAFLQHNSSRSSVLSEIAYAKADSQPKLRAAPLKTAIGLISV
jgi:hypothetical protein